MRFLLFLLAVAVVFIGLHLTLLYGMGSYNDFRVQFDEANGQNFLAFIPAPALTPTRFTALRVAAGLVLLLATGASWWLGRRRHFGCLLVAEARAAGQAVHASWQALSFAERAMAGGLMLAIAGVRVWFLLRYPFIADEAATYDYFVRCGPRMAASFYALPNNHILYSLLSWPVVCAGSPATDPDLLLRLPGFGLGLVATVMAYGVLARLSSWRLAFLATGLFQLSPMVVQYAVAARGYGLQATCVQAVLLAAVVLWRGGAYQRLGYAVYVAASVGGFYLIPTFLYPFLSLTGTLLLLLGLRRRGCRVGVGRVLAAAGGVLVLVALLYLPVVLVSGWRALALNPYVRPLSLASFWSHFVTAYLPGTVAELWGQPRVSIPGLLLLVGTAPVLWPKMDMSARRVSILAWFGLLVPVVLLMAQRVHAPARTLHYVLYFSALAAAALFELLVSRVRIRPGLAWALAVALIGGYGSRRLSQEALVMAHGRRQLARYEEHSTWLSTHHARRVLADVSLQELYFLYHYAYKKARPAPFVRAFEYNLPDDGYDYLLFRHGTQLPGWAMHRGARLVVAGHDSNLFRLSTQAANF